jgi:hypothetical protein
MSASVEAMLSLESELHRARLCIVQLEAQRDFLLGRLVDLEGDAWELPQDEASAFLQQQQQQQQQQQVQQQQQQQQKRMPGGGSSAAPGSSSKKRRVSARPETEEGGDRTGLCTAPLKTGKLCRRKATTGFVYCGYHLPLDPNSGFMYCTHARGAKKCGNPVSVHGDRLCKYHKDKDGSGGGGGGGGYVDDRGSDSMSGSD